MDPLSITGTVLAITACCVKSAKGLYSLRERYKHAHLVISAIYSEITVISASLSRVQGLILTKPETFEWNLKSQPQLEIILDTALTGCMLVFSILDDEVTRLVQHGDSMRARAAAIWNEDVMQQLLGQIRAQETSLTLLIAALQLYVDDDFSLVPLPTHSDAVTREEIGTHERNAH